MKFQRNVLLKNYTTFKIGGPAKYFYIAKTKEGLIGAIKKAKKLKLPFFLLGGGSNLLVSDKGFNGLVIKFGQPLSWYVSKGLEWAVGIPGTVQGAVYSNAGAFKKSMKDVVESVEVFDTETGKIKIFKNKDCQFSYRNSIFRKKKNLIILSVKIKHRAPAGAKVKMRTKSSSPVKIQKVKKIKQYLDYRKQTQPLNFPSAGSIFKNPKGFSTGELGEEAKKQKASSLCGANAYIDKASSSPTERAKLSEGGKERIFFDFAAARLIEKCGLKGKKIGNVKISEKHANFIVNLGQGKAKDVIKLIKLIKKKVKNKFKINLEEEIQFLGFKN